MPVEGGKCQRLDPKQDVALQSLSGLLTHPQDIVDELKQVWQGIMSIGEEDERMRPEDMQIMLQGLRPAKVTLPRLTAEELCGTLRSRRPTSP